jgi:predicted transcriptional regulator of viral defense system
MSSNLPSRLKKAPFTFKEALAAGLTQYRLKLLLSSGEIERVERGFYTAAYQEASDETLFVRATKRVGAPAVVCLLSALSHYELTDAIPKQVWLMVPKEKRVKSSLIKLYRARDPMWRLGVISHGSYSITTIERTIVDALTLKAIISPRMGIDALKRAIATKKTTATKVLHLASAMGVHHRVVPYVEALS